MTEGEKLIADMERVREEIRLGKNLKWFIDPVEAESWRRMKLISRVQKTKENSERYKKMGPDDQWVSWKVWKLEQLMEEIRNETA